MSSPPCNVAHPESFAALEAELVKKRRDVADALGAAPLRTDCVGLALSGGGIRSATFALGVLQALAERKILHAVDYLSTVSGGGYAGSFWTGWLSRGSHGKVQFEKVREGLADCSSREVNWLRENGRYLAPNGSLDAFAAFAVHLRNLLATHAVLGCALLAAFFGLHAAELGLADLVGRVWPGCPGEAGLLFATAGLAGLVTVGHGCAYWWIGDGPQAAGRRNASSQRLSWWLLLTGILCLVGLIDAAAWILDERHREITKWLGGAVATVFAGRQIFTWAAERLKARQLSTSTALASYSVATLLAVIWTVMLGWASIRAMKTAAAWGTPLDPWAWAAVLGLTLASVAALANAGGGRRLLNLSSHATLYAARLTRTYHGASNPKRHDAGAKPVTDSVTGDALEFQNFQPWLSGGPLHLINITVNETVMGSSQREQRDRKGLPLAVGPAGLSIGVRHHAAWTSSDGTAATVLPNGGPVNAWGQPHKEVQPAARTVGEWVAISGAAFSTGLGARTHRALSFLLGFANVRLGYWWASGSRFYTAPSPNGEKPVPHDSWMLRTCRRLWPTQADLLNEWLGRFHGPHRPTWYLSDGGHFENTGAYELIRRRLPLIIVSDAGADLDGTLDDFANLVRKARLDFNTEITVLKTSVPGFTCVDGLRRHEQARFRTQGHGLLARLNYGTGLPCGLLVLLKPSLTGDEPVDVLHYASEHEAFPQEPTSDQFFDEAQWESYRKLGHHIALGLLDSADLTQPGWSLER